MFPIKNGLKKEMFIAIALQIWFKIFH